MPYNVSSISYAVNASTCCFCNFQLLANMIICSWFAELAKNYKLIGTYITNLSCI